MLHDVEKACVNARSSGPVFNEIVARISHTMSDRGSVEKSCNALLHAFRSNVLPLVMVGWDSVATEERKRLCQVNNFYCERHYNYRRLGRASARKAWEKAHLEILEPQQGFRSNESCTVRLITTVCKALEAHCNDQSGSATQFRAYLTAHGVGTIPLARFVGNCLNIHFLNAGDVYYLRDRIEYFYNKARDTPNRLCMMT